MTARQDLRSVGVRACPIAFGMTKWGPLPGTRDMWIMWDGPGSGLSAYEKDPEKPGALGHPIRHATANGTYQTVAEAEKAVAAFVVAYLAEAAKS